MGMGSTRSKPRSHLAIAGNARWSFLQSPRPYFPLSFQYYTEKGLALLVAAQTLSVPESDPTILSHPPSVPVGIVGPLSPRKQRKTVPSQVLC